MESENSLLIESIENCLLPRLAKAQDETDHHAEFGERKNKLGTNFPILLKTLGSLDFRIETDVASIVLPKLIILDLELHSDGPWFTEECREYSIKLNLLFDMIYGCKIYNLLEHSNMFNPQLLFDKCIDELHQKVTTKSFKKYPSLIEVYCKLLHNVKDYKIRLNPATVLPISLLLIDDYNVGNKIKGLKCCLAVLECLTQADFSQGNYYEVICGSLQKSLVEKDQEVTKLTLSCLVQLLPMLPPDTKVNKTDQIYKILVDQMFTESNLYRKATCFNFTKQIIEILGVHSVKRKLFKSVFCDALDVCSNEGVAEILLQDVLECLAVWLKHCWCVWKLSSDQTMLSKMFKILFVVSDKDEVVTTVRNIIMTMIQLCTAEEQKQICSNLDVFTENHKSNESFLSNVEAIKKCICV